MNVVLWTIFGAISGWIVMLLLDNGDIKPSLIDGIVFGIIGGIIGGFSMKYLIGSLEGINLYSIVMAVGVSILLVVSYHSMGNRQNQ